MQTSETKITSVADLLQMIGNAYYTVEQSPCRPLFYRGHADKEWKLLPNVMRSQLFHERCLILDYKQVFELDSNYLENLERILVKMQHHGVPTRLLDWSISPLQALYFACSNKYGADKDGELVFINPWIILHPMFSQIHKPTYHFELMKRARFCLALGWSFEEISEYMQRRYGYQIHSKELNEPLPIVGRYLDKRVSDQQGMFLLWGNDKLALDFQPSYKNHIQRFVVPAKAKPLILSELSKLGITDFTTFRDFEGFKKAVDPVGSIFKIEDY